MSKRFFQTLKTFKISTLAITSSILLSPLTAHAAILQEEHRVSPILITPKPKKQPKLIKSNLITWGEYSGKKIIENINMDGIDIEKYLITDNIDCILSKNGEIYLKFKNDKWLKWDVMNNVKDICLTNDYIYIINYNGELLEFEYLKLLNKYKNPCIEDNLRLKKFEDCSNKDIYRRRSLSIMPVNEYYQFMAPEYQWTDTKSFISNLNNIYNDAAWYTTANDIITEPITNIYANDYRIFLITKSGKIYVKGDNQRGACGLGYEIPNNNGYLFINDFIQIPNKYFDSKIIDIALGEDHTLFLTDTGRIFSCGADNMLQLGLGWTKQKCIQTDENWTELGKKGYNATALAYNNTDNDKCEFYFEVPPYDEFYPRVLTGPYFDDYRVISISCGDYHNAAIIEPLYHNNPLSRKRKRKIYNNDGDIIEIKNIDGLSKRIAQIEYNKNIKNTNPDNDNQDLSDMRRVITWGCSLKGQLGHANYANASIPKPLKSLEKYREYVQEIDDMVRLRPTEVKCGKDHTIILMHGHTLTSSCMVFGMGSNMKNQICNKSKKKFQQPYWIQNIVIKPPRKLSHIAAGADKSAAFQ